MPIIEDIASYVKRGYIIKSTSQQAPSYLMLFNEKNGISLRLVDNIDNAEFFNTKEYAQIIADFFDKKSEYKYSISVVPAYMDCYD